MRKLLIALALVPALALAEGGPKDKMGGDAQGRPDAEKMMKRMRLARTLGLAEALNLDPAQALKLGDAMSKFDDRRKAVHQQLVEARDALRKAARDDKATAAEVDGAITKALDARAQLGAIDKESLAAVTKDLTPEQKARAVLFLAHFRQRIEQHLMMMHAGKGMGGDHSHMGPGMMNHEGMMMKGGPQGMMMQGENGQMAARRPGDDAGADDAPFAYDDD